MRYCCLLLVFFLYNCNGAPAEAGEGGEPSPAPVTDVAPAAAPPDATTGELTEAPPTPPPADPTVEAPIEPSKKEIERRKDSQMAAVDCCADVTELKQCCCDEVLKTFEDLLEKGDFDGAGALEADDPFYPACAKKFQPSFEDAIGDLLDKYL